MLDNTSMIYSAIQRFISRRDDARTEYLKRMQEIESYKGSKGYTDEQQKAWKKRTTAVEEARQDCESSLSVAFSDMIKKNARRTVSAPTEEELRLLQTVSLMTKPSLATLDAVAHSMKSAVAMAALDDIAARTSDNGHPRTAYAAAAADEMSIDRGNDAIGTLRNKCNDILRSVSGANRIREAAAEHNKKRYGVEYNADEFEREKPYSGEMDFLTRELGITTEQAQLFQKAVN